MGIRADFRAKSVAPEAFLANPDALVLYIAKLVPLLAGGGLVRPFGREFGGAGKKGLLEATRLIRTLLASFYALVY